MLGALEHRAEFDRVGVLYRGAQFAEFVDELLQRAADFFFVLETNLRPHLGGTAGDAGEILEAGADEIQWVRTVAADDVDDGGGDDVRKMADAGDDFVVFLR